MAYSYKNSQGVTYTLRSKTHRIRPGLERTLYYFAREDTGNEPTSLPIGYEVRETETGLPVLKPAGTDIVAEPGRERSNVFTLTSVDTKVDPESKPWPVADYATGGTTTAELLDEIRRGVSFETFTRLHQDLGISQERLAELLQIETATVREREDAGRFTPQESERIVRYVLLIESATRLFEGDREQAVAWLSRKRSALQNQTPLDYATTEIGAREVEDLIGRLEHGVFT